MFERPRAGERAIAVHVSFSRTPDAAQTAELRELIESAGAELAALLTTSRDAPDPRSFIGPGKVSELRALVETERADVVIFDHPLAILPEFGLRVFQEPAGADLAGALQARSD